MAFNDNFTSIDPNVWQNTYWWGGNAGTQATFDPSALSVNSNGLAITATQQGRVATTGAYNPYTSGVLTTGGLQGKKNPGFSFTYGYVETTTKVAPGLGMWSALWMLPTDHNDNRELDLMENLGRLPYNFNATYHWDGNYWQPPGNVSSDLTAGYHTFGVDWEPDHITWYYDRSPIGTFSNASVICNRAMYLILNLDVGGPWAGPLGGSSPYQSTWQIQDVRVWQHVAGSGDTTAPTPPSGLYASAKTANSATVSWSPSSDNVGVAGYNIFRNGVAVGSVAGNTTFFTDTGLAAGTTYNYTINAFDAASNISAASGGLAVTTNATAVSAPTAPTSVHSSSTTVSSVAVSWSASSDSVAVTGYNVYRNGAKIGTVAGNFTYLVDNGLAAGTTYAYTVNAFNAAGGVSATSAAFVVTTSGGAVAAGPALTQVGLASSFNAYGIASDGGTFGQTAGLGGSGAAYSANVLGTSQTWNGNAYAIGSASANNVVSAVGQTIALPQNHYASLSFLGTAVYGNQLNQTFVVHYTDGTTQTFNQNISDWYVPQGYAGEANALTVPYIDYASGARDTRAFHLYGYRFALNATKTVQSVTLPNNPMVQLLGIDLTNP